MMSRILPSRASVSITPEYGQLVVRTPYDPDFVADLKALPASDRRFDPTRKAWLVTPDHGQEVADMLLRHFGARVAVPSAQSTAREETRIVEVRYIGTAKDRGKGERTAFGWSDGGWNVILPEPVMREWFGQQAKPGELLTLYARLGCKPDVLDADMKASYRRLVKQWHPDTSREPDSAEQFRVIQHAYEVLRDPLSRRKYDAGLRLTGHTAAPAYALQDDYVNPDNYRSPLRCGLILADGLVKLDKFNLTKILNWADVTNTQGQSLVSSWAMGDDHHTETWA